MVTRKKPAPSKSKIISLRHGRPPLLLASAPTTIKPVVVTSGLSKKSSKATRTLINTHHQLHKSRAKALAEGKDELVANLDAQIEALGGLTAYQAASLQGQDKERGGDSSEKLVDWLGEFRILGKDRVPETPKLRVLEVGALSSKNAISAMIGRGVECVKRIDLHSQEPKMIEEVDFMDFPIPKVDSEKFDIISLSLVLNYVPDPKTRGGMLSRTVEFLRHSNPTSSQQSNTPETVLPCLFFVVPLSCLENSRYMNTAMFGEIMNSIGYKSIKAHKSNKLYYELFQHERRTDRMKMSRSVFRKVEVNPGSKRNNFCIILNT